MQPSAIIGIRLGIGLVPIVFLAVGFIFLYFFPLRGAKYTQMKEQVKSLHEKSATNTREVGTA